MTTIDTHQTAYGGWVLCAAVLTGFAVAVFNYFWTANGIHGTGGALVVIASTLLILITTIVLLAALDMPRWLRLTLAMLIGLDILGTGLAAYMLEANWLLAAMAVALIGWVIFVSFGAAGRHTKLKAVES
jgi:hypothetical protein